MGDKADVIVALGAMLRPDGTPTPAMERRTRRAVDLLLEGRADNLIVSGGAVGHPRPEAEAMRDIALALGAPDDKIVLEPQARNTFENAVYSKLIMERQGWKRALVATDAYHIPRAMFIFKVLGIPATAAPCRDRGDAPLWLWYGAYLREMAALVKSAYLFAIGRHKPVIKAARERHGGVSNGS